MNVLAASQARHFNFSDRKSIMKKTLAALAVLGAFAGTAAAADVNLYGVVDTGESVRNFVSMG